MWFSLLDPSAKKEQSLLDDAYHNSGKTVSLTTKHTGIQDQSSEELMVMGMPCMKSSMMEMIKYMSLTTLLQI